MNTKIKVLFMQSQDQFWPAAMIHSLLMSYFNRKRLEVHVACTMGSGREKPPSLKVLETIPDIHLRPTNFGPTISHKSKLEIAMSTLSTGLPALTSMLGLVKYIKQHNIDIIHTADKPRDAFYGVLLAMLTGSRIVIHLHMKCDEVGSRVGWAMRKADDIIGISDFVAQTVKAQGYPPSKVHSVLNSIEASHWDYGTEGSEIRREFCIPLDAPVLTIIARLIPLKGHERLLKALAMIKNEVPGVKLLIVGEDDPDLTVVLDHCYSMDLMDMVHELGLTENVIFTGYRSDVQKILAACDLYTMPTFGEGFGMVFLEALAMKKPIIALDNGGTPEVVEQGKSGLLSPLEDIAQLAQNILTLINNLPLRRQMGDYGRMRVEQYFNPHRMTNDVESVYRFILGH